LYQQRRAKWNAAEEMRLAGEVCLSGRGLGGSDKSIDWTNAKEEGNGYLRKKKVLGKR
jgi:hypothetical protein